MAEKLSSEQLALLKAKLEKWCSTDVCAIFSYITDLHSGLATTDPLNSQKRETLSDILLLNRIAEAVNADFCANLGDVGIDVPLKEEDEMRLLASKCLEYHKCGKVRPVIFASGNHDCKKGYTPEFWAEEFRKINDGCPNMVYASAGEYGFFDLPEKKLRLFWLNCYNIPEHYSDEQCDFITANLPAPEESWCTAVVQHICLHQTGRWKKNRPVPDVYLRLHRIFADYVDAGGIFAGFFTGDSHFNTFACTDKVNYYVSQGYGGIGPHERPDHAKRSEVLSPQLGWGDSFDSSTDFLVEVVAINPSKRKAAVFRAGAGGEDFDCSWSF